MPSPASPHAAFTIPVQLAQRLERLSDELQVPPEIVTETAVILMETLLSYNRKGYSKAILKHAIFRNANRDMVIDIPAAADFYHQKLQRERQMSRSLGRKLAELEVSIGDSAAESAASGSGLDAKLVDLTIKIETIAQSLKMLLGDSAGAESQAESVRRAETLLAEEATAETAAFHAPASAETAETTAEAEPPELTEAELALPEAFDPFAESRQTGTPPPRSRQMQEPPSLY